MVFGFPLTLQLAAIGGVVMFTLLGFQLGTGMRWIKLPPKNRLKIHKATGITLVVLAVIHGSIGLILATGIVIG